MSVPALRFKQDDGQDFPEWQNKTLDDLASVERGKFSVRPRNDPKYFGGTIPFVQTGDVVFAGLFLTRFSQTLNDEGLKVSRLFPKDTVLITIAANIGDTTITKFDIACTDSVVAIQPFKNMANPVWLKFILDTKKDELDSKATQNAQKNINLQVLKPLLFNTPTLQEQTKIANFLTAVDERITQLSQKHDLLTQYKKGVMQQIFSQELRFKDDDGRDFPEWDFIELSKLGKSFNGLTGKAGDDFGEGKPYITYKQIFDDSKIDVNKFAYVQIGENEKQNKVQYGDVFFTTSSETPDEVGFCSVLLNDVEGVYLNSFCFGYRINSFNTLHPNFARFIFKSTGFRRDVVLLAQGSTRFNISKTSFMEIEIKLPSIAEQTKIANFLTAIDDKITTIQTQLQAVKQYKQGLLQQMFV